jgi:hypothetical protein
VVRVKVVRNVRITARPGLEGLELALRLTHIAVEVIEITQTLGFGSRVRVSRVKALVVFDEDEDAILTRGLNQSEVVSQALGGWLGDQHVVATLNGV